MTGGPTALASRDYQNTDAYLSFPGMLCARRETGFQGTCMCTLKVIIISVHTSITQGKWHGPGRATPHVERVPFPLHVPHSTVWLVHMAAVGKFACTGFLDAPNFGEELLHIVGGHALHGRVVEAGCVHQ